MQSLRSPNLESHPPRIPVSARIEAVREPAQVAAARELFEEYAAALNHRICFESFREELDRLPVPYAPPHGELFLAWSHAQLAGCIGLRPRDTGGLELKRLYVRPEFRQLGIGRQLVRAALDFARSQRVRRVQLDTLPSMTAARALYNSFGFKELHPKHPAPDRPIDLALELEYPAT